MIPILPMNISRMMTILLEKVKSAVIPNDKPVVPNAEHTSKTMAINEKGSKIHNKTVAVKQSIAATITTTKDFIISIS